MSNQIKPGDKHETASVIMITDSKPRKVLLVHHKKFGKWLQPGGHQERDENSYEAALREVFEETGISISDYLPQPIRLDDIVTEVPLPTYIQQQLIPAHGDQPEHYHLDQNYVVYLPEKKVTLEAGAAHDIRWFTVEQLDTIDVIADLKPILVKYLLYQK